ncbi:MAG TPA: hypothetical protein PLD73_06900 [Candidatus Hydrogenedentes bacterium]|nr:hypothetical protein [Candidatus Hydrogenedentota bacterium]HOR27044.1 hypothetical protein [Candidatus Sumerlaeota bacterium]HPK02634.1 hypothetical protein [Candidatus Sumerlaeota bacterium]
MSVGMLMLVIALLVLAGLGITHKLADLRDCRPSAVNVSLFFWAAVVMWSYTLFVKVLGQGESLFPPFTRSAVIVAIICGTCASFGILTFQIGVRFGPITTSWLIVNLSTLIPAVLSLIIYQEWKQEIKWQHPVSLLLVLGSVFLLWRDKVVLARLAPVAVAAAPGAPATVKSQATAGRAPGRS